MKVWITKYALTGGIQEKNVELCESSSGQMVRDLDSKYSSYFHGKGKDWHETEESAVNRAEHMRQAKIKSLEKSIAKFKALKFTVSILGRQ